MKKEMVDLVNSMLDKGLSVDEVRLKLLEQGYMEHDVNKAISKDHAHHNAKQKNAQKIHNHRFAGKELFDRIGFGLISQQFLNIFLFILGGSYFVIGIVTGARVILTNLTSSGLKTHMRAFHHLKRSTILWGFLFVISLGLLYYTYEISLSSNSYWAFAFALIFSALTLVVYGDSYQRLFKENLIEEKKNFFLKRKSQIGIMITAVVLLIAGYNLEYLPILGEMPHLIFLAAAAAFFIAILFLFAVKSVDMSLSKHEDHSIVVSEFKDAWFDLKAVFLKNKLIMIMLFTGTITSLVQAIGATYYGIFIFRELGNSSALGGFFNVSIVFSLALFTSLIASIVTQKSAKDYGKVPMLVFGTLLIALMPLTFHFNPNLIAIIIATIAGVIGNSIVGVARGMLAVEYLTQKEQQAYFRTGGVLTTLPYLIFFPIGAYIAQFMSLSTLFLILAITLLVTAFPIYFMIILKNPTKKI